MASRSDDYEASLNDHEVKVLDPNGIQITNIVYYWDSESGNATTVAQEKQRLLSLAGIFNASDQYSMVIVCKNTEKVLIDLEYLLKYHDDLTHSDAIIELKQL